MPLTREEHRKKLGTVHQVNRTYGMYNCEF